MKILLWVLMGFLLASIGVNKYLYNQNQELTGRIITIQVNSDKAVSDAKNAVYDKQKEIEATSDELKNSKEAYAVKLDSVLAANAIKIKNLESALMINSQWADTLKSIAKTGKPFIVGTTLEKGKEIPVYDIPVSDKVRCWGMEGIIRTVDLNAQLIITKKTTNNATQLIVQKEKRFLFWVTRPAKYQIFNDCGEPIILNVKMQ